MRRTLAIVAVFVLLLTGYIVWQYLPAPRFAEQHTVSETEDTAAPTDQAPADRRENETAEPSRGAPGDRTAQWQADLQILKPIRDKELRDDEQPGRLGARIAQERTDNIIRMLNSESLRDSLEALGRVTEYYYPGFYTPRFREGPFDQVQRILSNRRFIKVYQELKALPPEQQYRRLRDSWLHHLQIYRRLLDQYEKGPVSQDALGRLTLIGDPPGQEQTVRGTALALQSLALVAGALGVEEMWPELEAAFRQPVTAGLGEPGALHPQAQRHLQSMPALPLGIRAEAAFLMARNAGPAAEPLGLSYDRVLRQAPQPARKEFELPNYPARVTPYDMNYRSGSPIDLSHGSQKIVFFTSNAAETHRRLLQAALQDEQPSGPGAD